MPIYTGILEEFNKLCMCHEGVGDQRGVSGFLLKSGGQERREEGERVECHAHSGYRAGLGLRRDALWVPWTLGFVLS